MEVEVEVEMMMEAAITKPLSWRSCHSGFEDSAESESFRCRMEGDS